MHLARAQRGAAPTRQLHDQPPRAVDAGGHPPAAGPRDLVPAQRVAGAVGLEQRRRLERRARAPGRRGGARGWARGRSGSGRGCPRSSCSSGGSSSMRSATLTPIPSTAQPSSGRPSARMPATLRPSIRTSLGHFSAAAGPATSATARPAASGSSAGGSRSTSESRSARPGGADHVRPWRPRPACCSPAVTSVPCGAPACASVAGAVVGRRRWRAGAAAGGRARSRYGRRSPSGLAF